MPVTNQRHYVSGEHFGARKLSRERGTWLSCVVLCLILVVLGLTVGVPKINSDGRRYVALALSLAEDGDFDLANQRGTAGPLRLRDERWVSPYAPGFALFYFPFLKPVVELRDRWGLLQRLSMSLDSSQAVFAPEALAILLGSVVYGCVALWISCRGAQCFLPPWAATAVAGTCFLGSQLVGYSLFWPSFSHALDAALVSAGLWPLVLAALRGARARTILFVAAGCTLGAAASVRLVNLAILAAALVAGLALRGPWLVRVRRTAALIGGATPWIAFLAWYQVTTYGGLRDGGYSQVLAWWPKHILDPLISSPHGLLLWSPFLAFALVGWFLLGRRGLTCVCVSAFGLSLLAMGFYTRHTEGAYYGCRYLVQFQLPFAIGLAGFLRAVRRSGGAARIVARTVVWLTAGYSLLLVPLAWWATPGFPYAESKQRAAPFNVVYGFVRGLIRPSGGLIQAGASAAALLPRVPDMTPLSLLTKHWGGPADPWFPVMWRIGLPRRPTLPPCRLAAATREDGSVECLLHPQQDGWPTVFSLSIRREDVDPSEGVLLTVRYRGREQTRLAWRPTGRAAWSGEDLGVFAERRGGSVLFHMVLRRPSDPDTLAYQTNAPHQVVPPGFAYSCGVPSRFLKLLWAASAIPVIEAAPRRVARQNLHAAPIKMGGLASYMPIDRRGRRVALPGQGAEVAVVCLPMAWRGSPTLVVRTLDGRATTVGPLEPARSRFSPGGRGIFVPFGSEGDWHHAICYVVLVPPVQRGPGRYLSLTTAERAGAGTLRVLQYGDAWLRDKRALLSAW